MMDKYGTDPMYGLGSSPAPGIYLVAPPELLSGGESRPPMAFGSEPVLRPGSCSPAISDAASAMAAEIRRGGGISGAGDVSGGEREKIASHRLFPDLLRAYVDCRKVGAPPDIAKELEEIQRENNKLLVSSSNSFFVGADSDPELDDFMENYCEILKKQKSDLSRPLDEATSFLSEMRAKLNDLCNSSTSYVSDEAVGNYSSEEEMSGGENEIADNVSHVLMANEERELKDKLLRKYSGYISSLKCEFSKKKKKGKLPKEARQALLDWWSLHHRWPYPTEGDKIALAELTGLDQKQINNWFINQRKRHWKPPENMHVAIMDAQYSLNYAPFYHE